MLLHFYERIFISLLHFHERILVSLLHFHERIDYHYALVASARNLRIRSLNVEYDMPQSCTASRPEISPHLTISTASANSGGILRRGRPKRTARSFGAPVSVSSARDRQRRSAASRTEMPRRTRGSLRPLRFARALVFDCAASLRKLRFTTAHFASRATPSRPSRSSAWFKGGETPPCELRA